MLWGGLRDTRRGRQRPDLPRPQAAGEHRSRRQIGGLEPQSCLGDVLSIRRPVAAQQHGATQRQGIGVLRLQTQDKIRLFLSTIDLAGHEEEVAKFDVAQDVFGVVVDEPRV